jgi:hypothetical protein
MPRRAVRRRREPQPPASIAPEPAQASRQHQPLEAQRGDRADIARQPLFPGAEPRQADKEDQGAAYHTTPTPWAFSPRT